MNIYLIERIDDDCDYDEYHSAVVVAPDENAARHMHPAGETVDSDGTWVPPSRVAVTYIGIAEVQTQRVILADFNAG